jgi:hypothetical protein
MLTTFDSNHILTHVKNYKRVVYIVLLIFNSFLTRVKRKGEKKKDRRKGSQKERSNNKNPNNIGPLFFFLFF